MQFIKYSLVFSCILIAHVLKGQINSNTEVRQVTKKGLIIKNLPEESKLFLATLEGHYRFSILKGEESEDAEQNDDHFPFASLALNQGKAILEFQDNQVVKGSYELEAIYLEGELKKEAIIVRFNKAFDAVLQEQGKNLSCVYYPSGPCFQFGYSDESTGKIHIETSGCAVKKGSWEDELASGRVWVQETGLTFPFSDGEVGFYTVNEADSILTIYDDVLFFPLQYKIERFNIDLFKQGKVKLHEIELTLQLLTPNVDEDDREEFVAMYGDGKYTYTISGLSAEDYFKDGLNKSTTKLLNFNTVNFFEEDNYPWDATTYTDETLDEDLLYIDGPEVESPDAPEPIFREKTPWQEYHSNGVLKLNGFTAKIANCTLVVDTTFYYGEDGVLDSTQMHSIYLNTSLQGCASIYTRIKTQTYHANGKTHATKHYKTNYDNPLCPCGNWVYVTSDGVVEKKKRFEPCHGFTLRCLDK